MDGHYAFLSNGAGCRICMMCHIQAETHSWILTTYGVEKKTCFKATDLKENLGQVFKGGPQHFIQVGFSEFLQS